MFKTGIWTRSQADAYLARPSTDAVYLCCFFFYGILRVPRPPSPADVSTFENITRLLQLSNGIYRTTYRGRMAGLDEKTCQVLKAHFPADKKIRVEDWGAADCLTTSEFAGNLWRDFPQAEIVATDLHFHLIEARHDWLGTIVFEEDGQPLQGVRPPFVISLSAKASPVYVVNRMLFAAFHGLAKRAWTSAASAQWKDVVDNRVFDIGSWHVQRIPLIHPEVLELAANNSRFRFRRHSVFETAPEPVDLIRTMNLLNRSYFSEAQLNRGIVAIHRSLHEGGIWIVGRTREQSSRREHHASMWQKRGGAFHLIERIREGSEIDDLIARTTGN
jgi:hypothetical protein